MNTTADDNPGPSAAIATYNQPSEISNDQLRLSVRSLNKMQYTEYNNVFSWCRNKMKNLNGPKPQNVDPLYLFILVELGQEKVICLKQSITQ